MLISEISPFLAFVAIGLPLPLSVVAILCIDLGTDLVRFHYFDGMRIIAEQAGKQHTCADVIYNVFGSVYSAFVIYLLTCPMLSFGSFIECSDENQP